MHCKHHFHEGVVRLGGQCLHPLSACGQAYRYALYKLNPFVVTGSSALYDGINAHGELDRHTPPPPAAATSPSSTSRSAPPC